MRRFLFAFLPLWVFLIGYAAGINVIIAAVIAGASVSLIAIYEKKKIQEEVSKNNDGNKVIK
jgi:NhaP-type Na+/H+ or K+/H+ antiporter